MKHLIIYSHPNPASFNHAILETARKALEANGGEVAVRDLYAVNFDPALKGSDFEMLMSGNVPADINKEQDYIRWADNMVFIYPIWWVGMPAMIKGYIDRVFTPGFAFSIGANGIEKLLTGKKGVIFNTQGQPGEYYEACGMFDSLKKTSDFGIFEFCGIDITHHLFFPSVPYVDDAARKGYLEEVKRVFTGTH